MVERFKTNDGEGQHTFAFVNMYILMLNILHNTINHKYKHVCSSQLLYNSTSTTNDLSLSIKQDLKLYYDITMLIVFKYYSIARSLMLFERLIVV